MNGFGGLKNAFVADYFTGSSQQTLLNGLCKVEHARVTEPSATQVLSQCPTECFRMATLEKIWLGFINQTFVKISQKDL